MKIFKYELNLGETVLEMPEPAKILSVQAQNNKPVLYVLIDEEESLVKKRIRVVATGQAADLFDAGKYIGTIMLDGGNFVLHAFEEVD